MPYVVASLLRLLLRRCVVGSPCLRRVPHQQYLKTVGLRVAWGVFFELIFVVLYEGGPCLVFSF